MAAEPPRPTETDPLPALRQLLAQRSDTLARQALASDGRVDADEAQSLHRLADTIDLLGRTRPQPARRRAPWLIALGVAALAVFAASLLRVRQTEVAMELSVSEVALRLAEPREVVPALALAGLGIAGAQSIELPQPLDAALRAAAAEPGAAIRLDAIPDGAVGNAAGAGSIDLAPLLLPKGARVNLSALASAGPGRYRLTLADAPAQLGASVRGPVRYTVAGQPPAIREGAVPKAVWLRSGAAPIDLDLVLPVARTIELSSPIEIDGLSLQHIEPARSSGSSASADGASLQPVSSLRAGTLYWSALDGKERKLLPHELLGFEQIRGQVSALRLEPGQITLRVQARVRGLALGSGDNQRSLMPTWLEWLRERHGLSLFWGSALYLIGLMAGIVRWWRNPS